MIEGRATGRSVGVAGASKLLPVTLPVHRDIMNEETKQRMNRYGLIALFAALLLTAAKLLSTGGPPRPVVRLPDGTEFSLAMVAFTNSYNYSQMRAPSWMLRYSKLIPDLIAKHFVTRGATIGMGSSFETNLMVVIDARNPSRPVTQPVFLRVRDDRGNAFENNSQSGVVSSGNDLSCVWRVSELPRRSKTLFLEPLVFLADGTWTNLGPFQITNPLFGEYPHWKPRPLPQSGTNGNLAATLVKLISGSPTSSVARGAPASPANPRSTRTEFSFAEDGHPVDHYRIHQLTLSDATGNKWSPYLGLDNNGPGWTTNGVAEFTGALWPGEDAWKIDLQALRTADFAAEEVWDVPPIPLPNPQMHDELTNQFRVGDLSIQLVNLEAPGVQVTNSWQWIVRYWGQESSIYAVGIQFDGDMKDRRLVMVNAVDQEGNNFKLVEHRGDDYPQEALFLQAPSGATGLRLHLAFPKLKKFEFLARPVFVEPDAASR